MKKRLWKYTVLFLLGIVLVSGQSQAVEPTPHVKRLWKQQGFLKTYYQNKVSYRDRGINTPARYAPNLKNLQNKAFGKSTQTTYLNALVILVDFPDHLADSTSTPAEFDTLLFSEDQHPTGSMNDWYLENSYGEIGVHGVVTPWLRMPESYSYYVDGQYGFGDYPNNAQKLTEDAIAAADSLVDYSQFDNDGDGNVDALFIVHAGEGRESSGSDNDIHSHKWAISSPVDYDGVTVYEYTMEPEKHGDHLVRMGVFGHEFGHALGLPDLYDTDYTSDGIGRWSMMAGGSWGGGGETPVHFDAWSKAQLGWMTLVNINGDSSDVVLPPVENTPTSLRMWTDGQQGPEYFLLENRQHTGFDVSLPGEGLLIWHIDERVSGNSDDWHKLVSLEQADGMNDLENGSGSDSGDPYPGTTGNTSFTGLTTPNSNAYSGDPSFVGVTEIAAPSDSVTLNASVSYEVPFFTFQGVTVRDLAGNNDQALNAGETDTLSIALDNQGLQLLDATVTLSSPSAFITMLSDSVKLDSLPGDAISILDTNFVIHVDTSAEAWSIAEFHLVVTGADNYEFSQTFSLIVDQGYGFASEVEDDSLLWTHYPVTDGYSDQWYTSTLRNATSGGTRSWRLGDPNGSQYGNRVDAALQTPVLKLKDTTDYRLIFKQYMSAEDDIEQPGMAWDGGRIEISTDAGSTWSILTPPGGYPYSIIDNPDSPFDAGAPAFSGTVNWEQVAIPLDGYSGDIVIRFRFGSDGYVTEEGWYIDEISVSENLFNTDVALNEDALPEKVHLSPNYPNPFNPETTIPYELSSSSQVAIAVFDLRGKKIRTLVNKQMEAGKYTVNWDGRDQFGTQVGSGMYFIRMTTGEVSQIQKMTLLR